MADSSTSNLQDQDSDSYSSNQLQNDPIDDTNDDYETSVEINSTHAIPLQANTTTANGSSQRISSTKDDFHRNELDPPLVAATLIPSQHEEERNPILSIQNDTVEPLLVVHTDHDCPEGILYEDSHQQRNSQTDTEITISDIVRVFMDDEPPSPMPIVDQDKKHRQHGYVRLLCIVAFCCSLGAVVGLSVASRGGKQKIISFDGGSQPSIAPSVPFAPTNTITPTISTLPSSAPSCPETFRLAWKKNFTDTTFNSLYNIAFASNAYWEHSQSGKILGVFLYNDYFNMKLTIHSFILSESGVEADMIQQIDGSWDIMSLTVSDDGTVLVLGIASAFSLIDEEGGAIVVFQRLTPSTDLQWNQTHIEPTGGGQYGTVFDVTVNGNGTIIAALAGSQLDVFQSFVGVYRNTNTGFKIMGDRLVRSSLEIGAKLELSGDGNRLFMATGDSRIQIFEYSVSDSDNGNGNGNYSGWNVSGQVFFEGSPNMHVSHDGDILVVASNNWDPIKVHAIVDARWETVDSFKGAVEGLAYSYQSTLSNDGTNIFVMALINNDDEEGVPQAVGEWFRHGPDGYKSVSSLPLSADSIVRIAFNEDASQLVVASLFELLGLERICNTGQTVTPSPSAAASTVSLSPTVCFTDYKENWYVNTTRTGGTAGRDSVVDDAPSVITSQDGSTMVVIRATYKNSTVLHVETFSLSSSSSSSSQYGPMTESKILLGQTSKVNASAISGDGYTMLLGVSSYAQSDGNVGGAFLVYHRSNASWYMYDSAIETGGGASGSVFDVTCSHNGSVVAFYAAGTDGGVYVDVYAVNKTGLFRINKQGTSKEGIVGVVTKNETSISDTFPSAVVTSYFPEVIVSGSGSRLFISSDMTVRSLDFDFGCDCWIVAGQSIENVSNGKIHVSFDGNLVAIGVAHFPICIHVFDKGVWKLRESASQIDNTGNINEALALIALSSDGKSFFIVQTYYNHDSQVAFPYFELSQSTSSGQQSFGVSSSPTVMEWLVNKSNAAIQGLDDTVFQTESNSSIISSERLLISFGQFFRVKGQIDSLHFASFDLNFTLPPGSLQGVILAMNGNLIVTTSIGTSVYQKSC